MKEQMSINRNSYKDDSRLWRAGSEVQLVKHHLLSALLRLTMDGDEIGNVSSYLPFLLLFACRQLFWLSNFNVSCGLSQSGTTTIEKTLMRDTSTRCLPYQSLMTRCLVRTPCRTSVSRDR